MNLLLEGLLSIFWILAVIGFITENARASSAGTLTFWMCYMWLLSDIILLSTLENFSTILIFIVHTRILFELVLILQWIYFEVEISSNPFYVDYENLEDSENYGNAPTFRLHAFIKTREFKWMFGLTVASVVIMFLIRVLPFHNVVIACGLWLSAILRCTSRVPQIVLNVERKRVYGKSFWWVLLAISNVLFLVRSVQPVFANLHWIIFCSVTVLLDIVIIAQHFTYTD
jgi:hypothetical protein